MISSRYDIYRPIHKGLRAFMADTLLAVGRMDADDAADTADVLSRVRGLVDVLHGHIRHENAHVHAAMDARAPGAAGETAAEHDEHRVALHAVSAAADAVAAAPSAMERAQAAHALYLTLAHLVGESLVHMDKEERVNNAVLQGVYSDAELDAIERGILATLTPDETAVLMRWILPALTPAERAGALCGMRGAMPAAAFDGLLAMLRTHLSPVDMAKLEAALAAPSDAVAAA